MSNSFYYLKGANGVYKFEYEYEHGEVNHAHDSIPSSLFLSVSEIVEHQLQTLVRADKSYIQGLPEADLISLHHNYGMWIRNSYGLWHPNNPYVVQNDLGDGHPDGLSMLVIEEIHKRLTSKADAFQDAMSIVQEK